MSHDRQRMVSRPGGCARGFTLVELLVVVAVVALLIAMLLPALGQARDVARMAVCLSNQRQIVITGATYAVDMRGMFPVNVGRRDYAVDSYTWAMTFNYQTDMTFSHGLKEGWQRKAVTYLKGYVKDAREFLCPMAEGNAALTRKEFANPTYYLFMSSYSVHWGFRKIDPVTSKRFQGPVRADGPVANLTMDLIGGYVGSTYLSSHSGGYGGGTPASAIWNQYPDYYASGFLRFPTGWAKPGIVFNTCSSDGSGKALRFSDLTNLRDEHNSAVSFYYPTSEVK